MPQHKWNKVEKFVCTFVFLISLFFVGMIFFAKWPNWWEWTVPEQSPMTWMQSLLLFLNVIAASSLAVWNYLQNDKAKMRWWILLAVGLTYLMLDERFAIHERIRDLYLAPQGVKIPFFFWTTSGDFILLLYVMIGVSLCYPYLKLFRLRKSAFYWLVSAFVIAVITIGIDSISFKTYSRFIQNVQQFSEELLEIFVMNSFFIALFLLLSFQIQQAMKK
jgi:hypothetical protein